MGLFDNYGPNTQQVKRFIERVKALTPEQRKSTEFEEHLSMSAFGQSNSYYVQVAAESTYGKNHEEELLGAASNELRKATGEDDPRFSMRANKALMGLALCHADIMDAEEFSTWYGPFARVIPIDSLGDGLAPKMSPASLFPPERFVTRIRRLRDWSGFENTHIMLMAAVGGSERHTAAYEAAEALLNEPPTGAWQEDNLKSLNDAIAAIESLGVDRAQTRKDLMKMIGAFLQRKGASDTKDWAQRMDAAGSAEGDFLTRVRHCCIDGVLALAFFGRLADEHAYYLYTPFEAVIPIDSVLP